MSPDRPERKVNLPPRASDSGRNPMEAVSPAVQPAVKPAESAGSTTGKEGSVGGTKKQLTAWIPADLHKRMQRLKVERDVDLKDQMTAAIEKYLQENGF